MKKTTMILTGLSCLALLGACSKKEDKMAMHDTMSSKSHMKVKAAERTKKNDHMKSDKMKNDKMKKHDKMKSDKMADDKMKKHDKMADDKMKKHDKMKSDKMEKHDKMKSDKMSSHDKVKADSIKTKNAVKTAPDFTLMDINGETHKLSDYKGKKIYLKFWASWCSICLSTLPDTQALADVKDKDYEVLTVVSPNHNNEKSEEGFKKWLSGTDYKNLPVLLDSKGQLLKAYGVRSYPTSAFIDSDGALVKTHIGYMDKKDIEKTLKEIK